MSKKKDEVTVKSLFDGHTVLIAAISIQNAMHPKNANRVEAIKSGVYKELRTVDDATQFLSNILSTNLRNEIMAIDTEIIREQESLQRMQDIKIVFESPDVFIAAAALISQSFYIGKGDRNAFFEVIIASDPNKIPDLFRKLMLVTKSDYFGRKIYNDKVCNTMNVCKRTIYQIWLHCVRRHQTLTLEQLIEFAPYMEENLRVYDKYVDRNGKTTLNQVEYTAYRKEVAEKKKVADKVKTSKKLKKGKL